MRKFIETVKHEIRVIQAKLRVVSWAGLFGVWR
jgi:hypothetical protein